MPLLKALTSAVSLPTRERELKPLPRVSPPKTRVAPHAGARIETFGLSKYARRVEVAPHAGARIETIR